MKFRPAQKTILLLFLFFLFALVLKNSGCFSAESRIHVALSDIVESNDRLPINAFEDGEKISFTVYSYGIKAGSGKLVYHGTEKHGHDTTQHITFQASTFSVKDREEIYGSLDFSYPLKVDRYVRLFGRNEIISESYAVNHKSVRISKRVNDGKVEQKKIEGNDELGNVILLIYKLRNDKQLKEGSQYLIVLPTRSFKLVVKGKRRLKVPLGVFEAFYIESEPAGYRLWLSNDAQKIPLRIHGVVGAGATYLAATEVTRL